jgi:FlaA1/EpsC-like NDP-sugar epimerase
MMNELFEDHRPQLVFHTAALKHVALLEQHIQAAFENNLLGTCILARTAVQFGVRKVITLSTDKAVNPTSIMGVSKRLAELALIEMSARDTSFISVRFGNVIGSRGSVIPLFQEQIRRREPVTVTDPQVSRYFLSISEAVRIILEAAWLGEGCEVFMPDLMKSIKILEIAEYLIQQAGLIPAKDIPIVFTGLRPGEKMFEELVYTRETLSPTSRPGILRVEEPVGPAASAEQWISEVEELLGQRKLARLLVRICELVPEYRPSAEILGKVKALPSHLEND